MNVEFRKNARPYVEENFSWKSVAKSVAGVYQDLITKEQESD